MIKTRQQLVEACQDAGILFSVDAIWDEKVPESVQYDLENPADIVDAFVAHPKGFPRPKELLILWSTNGEAITGYLTKKKQFIEWYLEDRPRRYEIIARSYQELAGAIVGNLIGMKNPDDDTLDELARFFGFKYLAQVKHFVETDSDWEDGIPKFVRSIE